MDISSILWAVALIIGILLNIFIGKLAVLIFKKDGTASRVPIRFIAVVLVLNGAAHLLHIN